MYRYMLLLKKKKYAAVTVEKKANGKMVNTTELKGRSLLIFFYSLLRELFGSKIAKKKYKFCNKYELSY